MTLHTYGAVSPCRNHNTYIVIAALSFLLLFVGFGRILSLALHDPLLAYANNYEMIPLQACHQIWPADKKIDITRGTPAAPLRDYTLGKHVDTSCFPGSELLFTSLGIELAKTHKHLANRTDLSIQAIGVMKALFLILTALMAHVYFFNRKHISAMLTNALVIFIVISDPGVTLYLNTFYTEFSAVYFLYLILIGISVLLIESWRMMYSLPLLIGLLGFGFARVQHVPLLFCMGLLAASYFLLNKRHLLALAIALCAIAPFTLQESGFYVPQNENMITANKINVMGSALETTKNPRGFLQNLGLPESCLPLAGKNWYAPIVQQQKLCFELKDISHTRLALGLLGNPGIIINMMSTGLPRVKEWVFHNYGQVESEKQGSVEMYYWTISHAVQSINNSLFMAALVLPIITTLIVLIFSIIRKKTCLALNATGIFLLTLLPVALYVEVLLKSGLVDLNQNSHLVVPMLLSEYILLPICLVSKLIKKYLQSNHQYQSE